MVVTSALLASAGTVKGAGSGSRAQTGRRDAAEAEEHDKEGTSGELHFRVFVDCFGR